MNVLVTGATGFIGQHLFKRLMSLGYSVFGISQNGGTIAGQTITSIDMTDKQSLIDYCNSKDFDGIFHLAAFVPKAFDYDTMRKSLMINMDSTLNMLEIFREKNRGVFVYASSSSIYGFSLGQQTATENSPVSPDNIYAAGKYFGEVLCEQFRRANNLCISSLRISAPYGPGLRNETVITRFIKLALSSKDLTIYGTGQRMQDFVYAHDIVDSFILAYEKKARGVFNIASGNSVSMKDLAEIVLKAIPDSNSKIVYPGIPDPQENYRPHISIEKAKKELGYIPRYSLFHGIKSYIDAL